MQYNILVKKNTIYTKIRYSQSSKDGSRLLCSFVFTEQNLNLKNKKTTKKSKSAELLTRGEIPKTF